MDDTFYENYFQLFIRNNGLISINNKIEENIFLKQTKY